VSLSAQGHHVTVDDSMLLPARGTASTPDVFSLAVRLAARTYELSGFGQLAGEQLAGAEDHARREWVVDARRWRQRGATRGAVISALADRITGELTVAQAS
jgi:hypothetical protein